MIMQPPPYDNEAARNDAELAQAFLGALETTLERSRDTPVANREEAEALFYDSLEAPSEEAECELLIQASETDPGNVAVLLSLREFLALSPDQEIEALWKIVALGERRLGKRGFKEHAGQFWNALETRSYMLARAQLADALLAAGKADEALAEWEAMMELNPSDTQGLRYAMLTVYLARERLDGAARLFAAFDECGSHTVFAWSRVLERFLAGDAPGAEAALAAARRQNGHTEAFLLGHRKQPKSLPDAFAPGSKEESECFAASLIAAWEPHAAAKKWLAAQAKPGSR